MVGVWRDDPCGIADYVLFRCGVLEAKASVRVLATPHPLRVSTSRKEATKVKAPAFAEAFTLVTHTRKSLHLIKQEGRRWREILDPMYREYKLQIRRRD